MCSQAVNTEDSGFPHCLFRQSLVGLSFFQNILYILLPGFSLLPQHTESAMTRLAFHAVQSAPASLLPSVTCLVRQSPEGVLVSIFMALLYYTALLSLPPEPGEVPCLTSHIVICSWARHIYASPTVPTSGKVRVPLKDKEFL